MAHSLLYKIESVTITILYYLIRYNFVVANEPDEEEFLVAILCLIVLMGNFG